MFCSSLSKKYWMAVTGLFLAVFVVVHLAGNLQIFLGPEWMNSYAEHLEELPALLWPMRVLLAASLLVHMAIGIWLAADNVRARGARRYAVGGTVQASISSRSMVPLGLAVFCFIIFHLLHFTFGTIDPSIAELQDAKGRHDVYSMVILGFQDPRAMGAYVAAMFFLAAHLRHGGYSFLQSLGMLREGQAKKARLFSLFFAVLIFLGYSSIAVSCYAGWLKPLQGAAHGA